MGFAQIKADPEFDHEGTNTWVKACDPAQDTTAQKNPSGAGTPTYPNVGVDCMGFAQKNADEFAQIKDDFAGSGTNTWVTKCDPS
jgi:hypothetical protein